jgi:lipoprotein NlpI
MKAFSLALAAALLLCPGTAPAQANSDAERCASITNNPDLAIKHCTLAIDSKQFTGDALAGLHYNRGVEWAAKREFDRAIADYDAAIRLNPKYADAYYNRGNAWSSKGEHDRAIADYDMAIRLNPKDAAAYSGRAFELVAKGDYAKALADYDAAVGLDPKSSTLYLARGRLHFYSGDYSRAVADLERSMKLDDNNYTALWLYLARKRAGAANAEEQLENETRTTRGGAWPSTVIVFYLGRTDAGSVMAAATDSDPRRNREQRCEANFYVAHWHLLRKENERAVALLREAQSGCPRDFLEHEGAVAELRRLQAR